ncbi:MAG TPA: TerB family tellurite resistance protein [Bacteroidia bacterium]|nr:TerB family tellurite resistance protein [Bacteroidia bacterium]
MILKWIGGVLGYALDGPVGGVIGFALGYLIDESATVTVNVGGQNPYQQSAQPNDFSNSLLILSAAVMKSDGKIMKTELDYVKKFLIQNFGIDQTNILLQTLKQNLEGEVPWQQVCFKIRQQMALSSKLQLVHFLFGIANADGDISIAELNMLSMITNYIGVSSADFNSIKAMFYKDAESDYKILDSSPNASDDEIKKSYRKLAIKFHPDKVSNLGEEVQNAAKEKFQKVQQAYENIRKKRGMN